MTDDSEEVRLELLATCSSDAVANFENRIISRDDDSTFANSDESQCCACLEGRDSAGRRAARCPRRRSGTGDRCSGQSDARAGRAGCRGHSSRRRRRCSPGRPLSSPPSLSLTHRVAAREKFLCPLAVALATASTTRVSHRKRALVESLCKRGRRGAARVCDAATRPTPSIDTRSPTGSSNDKLLRLR